MTYFLLFKVEIVVLAGNIVRIHWHLLGLLVKRPKRKRKIYCLENNGALTLVFYADAIRHLQTVCYLEQHMTHLKSTGT